MGIRMSSRSRNQQTAESSLVFFRAPNIKVLFLPCYKNASSSLLVWLAGLEQRASSRDAILKPGAEISRRGAEACLARDRIGCLNFDDYLRHNSDYFVFGISRNPYSRIVSAYRDKINRLVKQAMPDVYVRAVACQILEGPSSWSNNQSAIRHMRRMISFGDFLQKLALEGLGIDDHFQPQAVLMRPDLLPSAQFYKLEYIRETLIPAMAAHLSRQGYGSEVSPDLMPTQNVMGGSFDYHDFYGNGLMSLVEELYAPDFQPFGYKKGSL